MEEKKHVLTDKTMKEINAQTKCQRRPQLSKPDRSPERLPKEIDEMVSSSEKWKGSYVKEKNKNKSLKKPKEVPKGNGEEGRSGEREYIGIRK